MSKASAEFRNSRRYPLRFKVDYRVFGKGHVVVAGAATTLNISSHGLLLTPIEGAGKGQFIELSIRWTAGGAGVPRVDLEVIGRLVRVDAEGTAVQILRYGFHPYRQDSPASTIS